MGSQPACQAGDVMVLQPVATRHVRLCLWQRPRRSAKPCWQWSRSDVKNAKKVNKMIKDSKLKVQSQIQGEQIRVTGKKIDDLQSIIAFLKEENLEIPLQFINMKK